MIISFGHCLIHFEHAFLFSLFTILCISFTYFEVLFTATTLILMFIIHSLHLNIMISSSFGQYYSNFITLSSPASLIDQGGFPKSHMLSF